MLLREAERGAGPFSLNVLRHLQRGAPRVLLPVGLARRHFGPRHEATRRPVGPAGTGEVDEYNRLTDKAVSRDVAAAIDSWLKETMRTR